MLGCLMEGHACGTVKTLAAGTSGNNSVVECDLAKVEVAGSNPVSRSILHDPNGPLRSSGAVAKW